MRAGVLNSQPYSPLVRYKQWADRGLYDVVAQNLEWLDAQDAAILFRILDHIHVVNKIELPPAYLAKHLQALSRAGIVTASRGVSGGYCVAKPAAKITLLDITLAIEGSEPAFRCTEIRQQGPCAAAPAACKQHCAIAKAFLNAETQWRKARASISVADIIRTAASESFDEERRRTFQAWLNGAMK
jgi:Rrf2 family protein